jgi:hypothetical protein
MCGKCRSNAGRSERIRGIRVKLCRGGGQEVTHSSEFANPHGSVGGDPLPEPPGLVHVVQAEERGGAEDERADRRDPVQHGDVPGQVRVVRDPAGHALHTPQCIIRNVIQKPMNSVQNCH